jgi:Integrase zinc binding domain
LLTTSGVGKRSLRLHRWYDRLLQYNYTVEYRPGPTNCVPDLLSRCTKPAHAEANSKDDQDSALINCLGSVEELEVVNYAILRTATESDPTLTTVTQYVLTGWPNRISDDQLKPYYNVRDELSVSNEQFLVRGGRSVIPESLRHRVLEFAHAGRQGIVRTKQRCRDTVWWPGIDRQIEQMCADRVIPRLHYATGCTTVVYQPGWYNRLYNVDRHIHVLPTGWM